MPGEVRAEIGWWRALVDRDLPSALVARAQRGGGLMRIRVPLPGRFWLLTEPALIDRVLRTGATEFDKGGAIYRIIRTATGDEGLFVVNDPHPIFRHVAAGTELAGRRMHPGDQLFIALGPARLPFGTGKRKCIGEPMALLTGALSIAVLVQRFGHWQRTRPGNRQVRYATTAPPRHSAITFTR
ncbi:cytochrome P450 [Nocardia colli]|uniref:cytochrome P450 n=1 Tax=Nocardia colli TaxID=2545717 RepID=UPI0035D8A3B8